VELFPGDAEINYYLGFVSNRLGKRGSARRYLEKSFELDSNNTQTMLALATLYDEENEGERALTLYEALYKANPESPIVLNNFAYHLAERKVRLEEARQMVEKALALESQNGSYWDTLGWILYQSGAYAEAREKIEKSIALSPKSAEVWEHLGDVLIQLGEREPARKAYEQALQLDPARQQIKAKMVRIEP
jgi:Tfp pilus assembly protein PilF